MGSTTEKRQGCINQGQLYETLLCCYGVTKLQKQGKTFSLSNNIKNAGAFDDLVCTFDENTIFLQAKHKVGKKLINGKEFLNFNSLTSNQNSKICEDFSILKYLKSYIQIKYSFGVQNELFFQGNFVEKSIDLILFTPAIIDEETPHGFLVTVQHDNFIKTNSTDDESKIWQVSFEKLDEYVLDDWKNELDKMILNCMACLIKSQSPPKSKHIKGNIRKFFTNFDIDDTESFLKECCKENAFSNFSSTYLNELENMDQMKNLYFSKDSFNSLLKEFCSKFKIFTRQADVNQLENSIKSMISEINWNENETDETLIFNEYKTSFDKWMDNHEKTDVLSENCDFLRTAFDSVIFKGKHKAKVDSIASLLIYSDKAIRSAHWHEKLQQTDNMDVVNMYSDYPEFTLARISQFLRQTCPDFRIIDLKSFNLKDSKPRHLGTKFPCIILYSDDLMIDSTIVFFKALTHKLVIISRKRCEAADETIEDKQHGLEELVETSRKEILRREIMCQGKSITLGALVGSAKVNVEFLYSLTKMTDNIEIDSKITTANHDVNCREYFIERKINNVKVKTLLDIKQKIVLLVGEPGTGKSIMLTQCIENNIKMYPEMLIVRINLSTEENTLTAKFAEPHITDEVLLSYFKSINKDPLIRNEHMTSISDNLFDCLLVSGKVIVAFDGCDEINQTCQNVVLEIVSHMNTSTLFSQTKICITTRPTGIHTKLEDCFNIKYLKLGLFTNDECKLVLYNYWSNYMKVHIDVERIRSFVRSIVDYDIALNDRKTKDFLRNPMLLIMQAYIWTDSCIKFCDSPKDKAIHAEVQCVANISDLYAKIVKEMIKHKPSKKKGFISDKYIENIIDCAFTEILRVHKMAGLHALGLENIITGEERNEYIEMVAKVTIYGIISKVSIPEQEKPSFFHHTFIDYFVALFFWERYFRFASSNFEQIIDDIVIKRFVKENQTQVCLFIHKMAKGTTENGTILVEPTKQLFNQLLKLDFANECSFYLLEVVESCLRIEGRQNNLIDCILSKKPFKSNLTNQNKLTWWHIIAKHGYFRIAELLFSEKDIEAEVNATDDLGRTILYCAVLANCREIVDMLMKIADVNIQTIDGNTPLFEAVYQRNNQIIDILLKNGAKPDIKNKKGWTPLCYAIYKGYDDIAKQLIKDGNINAVPILPRLAMNKGEKYKTMIVWSLENGADIKAKDNEGMTALHVAASTNFEEAITALIENAKIKHGQASTKTIIDIQGPKKQTALMIASKKGYTDIANILLKNGADLDIADSKGKTALRIAAFNGKVEIVKRLLELNPHMKIIENDQKSPLDFAEIHESKEIFELMHGAIKKLIRGEKGLTMLDYAVIENDYNHVENILKNKTQNINSKSASNMTPLGFAARFGFTKIGTLLIKYKAHLENNVSPSPLYWAIVNKNDDIANMLLDNEVPVDIKYFEDITPFSLAVSSSENVNLIGKLLKKTVNNCKTIQNSNILLNIAVKINRADIVDSLLKKIKLIETEKNDDSRLTGLQHAIDEKSIVPLLKDKAKINIHSANQKIRLYFAVSKGFVEIVKMLLDEGSNIDLAMLDLAKMNGHAQIFDYLYDALKKIIKTHPNIEGLSTLHCAVIHNDYNRVQELISTTDNAYCKSESKITPLGIAARFGFIEIGKLLLKNKDSIKIADSFEHSALYYAVVNKNDDFAKLLLDSGAFEKWEHFEEQIPFALRMKSFSNMKIIQKFFEKWNKSNAGRRKS